MAITDLTGTSWVFNPIIDLATCPAKGNALLLDFTSRGTNYTKIYASGTTDFYYGKPSYTDVYSTYQNKYWKYANEAYRIISITGGANATNASLISWLQANASPMGYLTYQTALKATADAIRAKGGTAGQIEWKANGFADAITNMVVPIPSDYGHISWDGHTLTVS